MAVTLNASASAGLITTADTSTILQLQTGGTTAVTVDASQNVGIGVTPAAWGLSGAPALQIKNAAFVGYLNNAYVTANTYFDSVGGARYIASANASYYAQTSGQHQWFTAASGTAGAAISLNQAMTLDASGYLLVGATSSDGVGANRLQVGQSGATAGILIKNSSGHGALYSTGTDLYQTWASGGFLALGHAPANGSTFTERARIDSSGRLLVGVTSGSSNTVQLAVDAAAATLRVIAAAATTANQFGISCELNGDPNNTSQYTFAGRGGVNGTTDRAVIRSNGGLANYSANNVNLSDRREKTNFAPAGSYLDKICAIPVQTFNYIDQNLEEDAGLTLGVVAQDVQAVAPELVMESNWASKDAEPKMRLSIYQTDLQYALMKCIQEQQAIIQTLTDRITALEGTTP